MLRQTFKSSNQLQRVWLLCHTVKSHNQENYLNLWKNAYTPFGGKSCASKVAYGVLVNCSCTTCRDCWESIREGRRVHKTRRSQHLRKRPLRERLTLIIKKPCGTLGDVIWWDKRISIKDPGTHYFVINPSRESRIRRTT